MAKSSSIEVSGHEPNLHVVKPRKRRAPSHSSAPLATVPGTPSGSSMKPLLIGVGIGSAVVLAATVLQSQAREGSRAAQFRAQQPTLFGALAKTAAVAVARVVAKRVGRDLAERALPELANRAIVAFSSRLARH